MLLLLTAMVIPGGIFAQTSQSEFSLDLEMEQASAKIGSDIKGKLILTNQSDHEVYKDNSGDAHQSGYTIELRDAQGNTPQLTIAGSTILGSGGAGPLKPGKAEEFTFDLDKMYHIVEPGVYTVQGKIFDNKINAFVKSNTVSITLTK